MPRAVHLTCVTSSNRKAKMKLPMPAKVTCQAIPLNGSTSADCQRFESTDPSAQLNDPPSRLRDHQSSRDPTDSVEVILGHSSTTIPAIPKASPANARPVIL